MTPLPGNFPPDLSVIYCAICKKTKRLKKARAKQERGKK